MFAPDTQNENDSMQAIFGIDNPLLDYLLVLLVYFFMFLFIKYPHPAIEARYKPNFYFLGIFWFVAMFTGNYFGYLLGVMSFLPWFNNLIHCALWIGICLNWLYYCCYQRPMVQQIIFFAFTSFIIKMTEMQLLGTWYRESYFGIHNQYAYLVTMSLVDGFYPIISKWLLSLLGKKHIFGVYDPALP